MGKSIGVTGELICYVEGGQRHLHLDKIPNLASTLACDRKYLCRLALQEFAPALYAELFAAAVPIEPGSLSEYLEWAEKFHAVCEITTDPDARPGEFEADE